jgi:RNA-splicing ligase RtcB
MEVMAAVALDRHPGVVYKVGFAAQGAKEFSLIYPPLAGYPT